MICYLPIIPTHLGTALQWTVIITTIRNSLTSMISDHTSRSNCNNIRSTKILSENYINRSQSQTHNLPLIKKLIRFMPNVANCADFDTGILEFFAVSSIF